VTRKTTFSKYSRSYVGVVILDVYLAHTMFCSCVDGRPAYRNLFNTREYESTQHVADERNDTVDEDMQNVLKQ